MTYVEDLRAAHLDMIEDNPITLDLHLEGKRKAGGAFEEVTGVAYRNVRCRLYQEATGRSAAQQTTSVLGEIQVDPRWALLLPAHAENAEGGLVPIDITIDPDNTIWFEHPDLGRFRMLEIYPNQDLGTIWGWRAVVERWK